jgi:hypothetical protein
MFGTINQNFLSTLDVSLASEEETVPLPFLPLPLFAILQWYGIAASGLSKAPDSRVVSVANGLIYNTCMMLARIVLDLN